VELVIDVQHLGDSICGLIDEIDDTIPRLLVQEERATIEVNYEVRTSAGTQDTRKRNPATLRTHPVVLTAGLGRRHGQFTEVEQESSLSRVLSR
jgi:hypothetical protein